MYGVKFENEEIVILEGSRDYLKKQNCHYFNDTYEEARYNGVHLEEIELRNELCFYVKDLDSPRAHELAKRILGNCFNQNYITEEEFLDQFKELRKKLIADGRTYTYAKGESWTWPEERFPFES